MNAIASNPVTVTRYQPASQPEWDRFIASSKNGTFLLMRPYMEYHSDRFTDHSLMFTGADNKLLAVLPAHQDGAVLASHNGLTYGGIISDASMTTPLMLTIFDALLGYCQTMKIGQIRYKTIPSIYASIPAEEDRYALFRHHAKLFRRDVLAVIDRTERLPFQERRQRKIKQAKKAGLEVRASDDLAQFWAILEENLTQRFGVKPVHSLNEIKLLAQRFPNNIVLYACYDRTAMLAGVLLYKTLKTLHVQYISANERGKALGALDLVFSELLDTVDSEQRYFDFGISTEDNGMQLNTGLIEQKEGFGARAIVHDMYEIILS